MRLLRHKKVQFAVTVLLFSLALAQEQSSLSEQQQQQQQQQPDAQQAQSTQRQPQQGGGSGFGGLLSGLLGTITKTAETSECPGKCIHALASLLCDEVREDIQCPSEGLRCCIDRRRPKPQQQQQQLQQQQQQQQVEGEEKSPAGSTSSEAISESEERTTEETTTSTKKKMKKKKPTTERTTSTSPVLAAETKSAPDISNDKADKFGDGDVVEYDYTSDNGADSQGSGSSASDTKTCPGVCVAERLSGFCEAILNIEGICKTDLKCCVSKQLFNGKLPPELVSPSRQTPPAQTTPAPTPTSTQGTTSRTTQTPKRSEQKNNNNNNNEGNAAGSFNGGCRGTCVSGFFTLLCDEIDRSATCPGNGRCCLTKKVEESGGNGGSPPRQTSRPPPATKHPAPPLPQQKHGQQHQQQQPKQQQQPCPGICLPQMMSNLCTPPSVVLQNTATCQKGTVCCDSKGNGYDERIKIEDRTQPPPPAPAQERPAPSPPAKQGGGGGGGPDLTKFLLGAAGPILSAATGNSQAGDTLNAVLPFIAPILGSALGGQGGGASPTQSNGGGGGDSGSLAALLPLLGSFIGGGGGGGNQQRPPPRQGQAGPFAPPQTTATTTTTTTTTTEKIDDRPECPGTCIIPYVSFTCFGNAEITDLFKCENKKTTCCSPKKALKHRQAEIKKIEKIEKEAISRNNPKVNQPSLQSHLPHHQRQPPRNTFNVDDYENDSNDSNNDDDRGNVDYNTIKRNDSVNSLEYYPFPTTDRPTLEHPVTNKYVCGVKGTYRSGRVVGGEDGTPGEWCWNVALINSLNQYLCGGALIGTQWVLTAAHCVTNIVRAGDAIYVRVGDHDLTQKFGSPGAQTLRVATTYIHHNHNSQTLDNDIAILKLHGEADLKEGVCLVCLPARGTSQQAGKRCTVTGYGYMGESGPIPLRVREAPVPIVNDNECVRKINTVTEKIFILPASSFCAGGEEGNDACQGDGGGPMVCEDNGYYELTGLVSWGFGCGRKDVPGVYVKISSFIGWINQIISVNNL